MSSPSLIIGVHSARIENREVVVNIARDKFAFILHEARGMSPVTDIEACAFSGNEADIIIEKREIGVHFFMKYHIIKNINSRICGEM